MKDLDPGINKLSEQIIGASIEVHRELGPGLLETIYEQALSREFTMRGIPHERQVGLTVHYKGEPLEGNLRLDMVVANSIILELKAVDFLLPLHEAQLLSYLKLTGMPLGLLMNFHAPTLRQGIRRLANTRHLP
jgi:GxxExxY protein